MLAEDGGKNRKKLVWSATPTPLLDDGLLDESGIDSSNITSDGKVTGTRTDYGRLGDC